MAQLFDVQDVFDLDYQYFYETVLTPEVTLKEVDVINRLLDLNANMKVLDIPCGPGRISKQLATFGCEVTGIDASKKYIDVAKIDAKSFNLPVNYICEDMRNILFSNEYDAIINWHNSIGYFDDYENRKLLISLKQALKPGGKLLIEQVNRDKILRHLLPGGALWTDAIVREDNMMIDRIRYNTETGRMDVVRVVHKDGESRKVFYSFRLFTFPEIKSWLLNAGFSHVEVFSEKGGAFTLDSKRMLIVAHN